MADLKPYIIRALHEWAVDGHFTPQITIDTSIAGVVVPSSFASDGRMVLNIHPTAVRELLMGNESISFSARFSGVPHNISVPINAILAIFCRENGRGIVFDESANHNLFTLLGEWNSDDDPDEPPRPPKGPVSRSKKNSEPKDAKRPPKKGPPNLKVVK